MKFIGAFFVAILITCHFDEPGGFGGGAKRNPMLFAEFAMYAV